jgi:site-specific DNA recombinase
MPGDPKEVEVVQWLFAEYATKDVGFRWLAKELNAKGVPAPQGAAWPASAIVRLLANDAYVGDTRFGRRSSGKFYRLEGDKVVKADRNAPVEQRDGLVRKDTHEGIVSRDLWDQVQAKLNRPSKKE